MTTVIYTGRPKPATDDLRALGIKGPLLPLRRYEVEDADAVIAACPDFKVTS